jgi:signal transduction histidine kinase
MAEPRTRPGGRRAGDRLRRPTEAEVLEAAFALARELSLERREEELVGTFAEVLRRLLPGRLVCLRVIDPRSFVLSSLIADGPLGPAVPDGPLELKRSAVERTHLPESAILSPRVRVVEEYRPVFRGAARGFSVPLVASGELFGLLNLEYRAPTDLLDADERVVIPLANQLSVALRNLNLLGEARYYRDYLRQIIDVANALILVIDRQGRVAVANTALQRYLRVPPDIVGWPLSFLRERSTAPEPRLATLLLDGLEGKEYTDREIFVMRSDGAHLRAVFNTSVLRRADRTIEGVIGIGQDRERVRSLEHQVIQAEKLATLGQLAAGVVHELNNPLTAITVFGESLLGGLAREPEEAEQVQRILEATGRIQNLTRDLMSYARPSGALEPGSINEVTRQALIFCEHVIAQAGARVETALADGLPRVPMVRTQIHQVLINLITNACHALKAPGGTVEVRTALESDGQQLCIEVVDDGVGIEELDQGHIFEPFFTTKKVGKGTGLGLSIVKNIVEGHGGRVSFNSRVGGGTRFVVTLPLDAQAGKEESQG